MLTRQKHSMSGTASLALLSANIREPAKAESSYNTHPDGDSSKTSSNHCVCTVHLAVQGGSDGCKSSFRAHLSNARLSIIDLPLLKRTASNL
jgi:hypothetical protein